MSLDYTVHLGPFVECVCGHAIKEKTRRGCTNVSCHKHWNLTSKFCEECGSPIGEVKYNADSLIVHPDPMLVNEQLSPIPHPTENNTYLWVPNLHRPNRESRKFSFSPTHDGEQYMEITPELMATETTEFIDQYRDAISNLRAAYGLENVTIKWGLIHDIN